MLLTKRRKTCEQQLTHPGPSRPNKLFVDYPYPILNELEKSCIKRKTSGHSSTSAPLQWYNHYLLKRFGMIHDLHKQDFSPSILELSSKQLNADKYSSAGPVDKDEKKSKAMRIKRLLARLRNSSINKLEEPQGNEQKHNTE